MVTKWPLLIAAVVSIQLLWIWFALQQHEEQVRLEMSTASAQRAAFLSKHATANCSSPASVTFEKPMKQAIAGPDWCKDLEEIISHAAVRMVRILFYMFFLILIATHNLLCADWSDLICWMLLRPFFLASTKIQDYICPGKKHLWWNAMCKLTCDKCLQQIFDSKNV